jgi:hypothetical protein
MQTRFDSPSAGPKRGKLSPCHHPMLTLGQLSDPGIQRTRLL